MKDRHVCEHCHGVLTPTRRISLAYMLEVHEDSCPGVVKMKRKAPVAQLAEASDSSSESVGSTPTGGTEQPRKRYIKRIVV